MRKLFGKRKDRDLPPHPAINSGIAPVQGNQPAVQASQVRPGEPFRSQGDELARNNDYNGAVVMYDAALRSAPNDLSLLLSRSMAHSMAEPPNLDLALKDADRVIQLNPSWWQGWLQRGQMLLRKDDLQSAEEALTNAAEFAQDFDRITAQRALADVRARRAQGTKTTAVPAPEKRISNGSNLPLRPASTISPLQSSASGIASQTTQSPSTALSATLNPPARASAPHESGTSTALPSVPSTSTSTSSTPRPKPGSSPRSLSQNVASASTANQSERRNPVDSAARTTGLTLTHGLNDLLDSTESPPSDAPPAYSPNLNDRAQLQRRLDELVTALEQKNKGGLSIRPYTLPGSVDAIRLVYTGLTELDLTPRERGTPTYLHPKFMMMAVGTLNYPGNTFLDMDCESSAYYDGKSPGTSTISGYSEEYRAQQLLNYPLLNIQLEGNSVLPDVAMGNIVDRLRMLKLRPTLEDNTGLKTVLGLSELSALQFGFHTGGSRQKQISYMCMALTRSLYDAPSRFIDCSKARFFSSNTLGAAGSGIGLKNFLYQILIGAELLIRLRKEPVTTNYSGLVGDAISGLIVLAALWMENVVIQGPKAGLTKDDPKAYTLYASQNQHQAEALIRFGEAMEWPYMDEARNYIENAYEDLIAARPAPSWDIYDWLFGLVLPGKIYRHRIMACLVHSSPTIRSIGSAPYWENGLVVKDKSYWPRRTVMGRVLGGVKGVKSVCGWIGPLPAPKEDISGWIRLKARNINIPVPVQASLNSESIFRDLGFDEPSGRAEDANAFLESVTNPDEWVQVMPPTADRQPGTMGHVQLKAIHLNLVPASQTLDVPTDEYRASLDFEINRQSITYTLYSNPVFVAAPPCVGRHVLHQRQAQKYKENVIRAVDLKSKYPPTNQLVVIDAMGEGEEVLARAWCAERGRHAIIRKGEECCFPCATSVTVGRTGLGVNVLIMSQ